LSRRRDADILLSDAAEKVYITSSSQINLPVIVDTTLLLGGVEELAWCF